jgi:hypothetical protein
LGGGAWPFLVRGVSRLLDCDNERDLWGMGLGVFKKESKDFERVEIGKGSKKRGGAETAKSRAGRGSEVGFSSRVKARGIRIRALVREPRFGPFVAPLRIELRARGERAVV